MLHTFPDGRREPVWSSASLIVEFLDGSTVEYPNVRFLAVSPDLGYTDPIKIEGTTLTVENFEQSITILGVRHFTMEFPD